MQFRKGDKVKIVSSVDYPEYRKYVGRTAKVYRDGPDSSGLVAVQGLESKVKERVLGYVGFAPEDLQKV
ncbi:hypothetical protein [Streptomyces sp. ME19-01-6]|uniref:hypothetical protein n=1 Tax=Streptomyces sp. ME19-01-6 TaxID=3028686 RepID=UPI0029AEE779|nr:hypothetical protein [Streptomyces sp. ME19-01-6]MDX3230591.1 hypothetical protein [Streptomyces sp. ME19-01-6]